ncbi:WD40 repeat protein [Pseudoloma neurophilia]|uniref:WD40 repeat protein n=1 Tax=Pseudoloma neurophilia TaxID=146866 RepID=A0A0R0M2T2_9MICR|nr:WD40 repeat protein [Pseudoloma neurophilia]
MKITLVYKKKFDDFLLCLAVDRNFVYTAGSSKKLFKLTHDLKDEKVICQHDKSIRCVAVKNPLVMCGSFDGNATLLYNDEIYETIEGPETEIKSVCILNNTIDKNRIALCSRGRTAWVLKLEGKIEIESVLEDHLHDVKGIRFIDNMIITFGYDKSIKIYRQLTEYDGSWVLYQSIDLDSTIWDITFIEKEKNFLFAVCHDGSIAKFVFKDKKLQFEKLEKVTLFPIYTICNIDDRFLAINLDLYNIAIFDLDLKFVEMFKCELKSEINSIRYHKFLYTVDDNGYVRAFKIDF